jgi:hypothetical protein
VLTIYFRYRGYNFSADMKKTVSGWSERKRIVFLPAFDLYHELDMMLIILNTSAILWQKISSYPNLKTADKDALKEYEIIADGTGIHWSALDEDLSLKGFLRDELRNIVRGSKDFIAA